MRIGTQTLVGLVDSGNSTDFDLCIRAQVALDLNLKINKKQIKIGSASTIHEMKVLGETHFTMFLEINNKSCPFNVSSLVISDLSDPVNLGSQFLKK